MTIGKVYNGGTQTRRQYGMWQKSLENKPKGVRRIFARGGHFLFPSEGKKSKKLICCQFLGIFEFQRGQILPP